MRCLASSHCCFRSSPSLAHFQRLAAASRTQIVGSDSCRRCFSSTQSRIFSAEGSNICYSVCCMDDFNENMHCWLHFSEHLQPQPYERDEPLLMMTIFVPLDWTCSFLQRDRGYEPLEAFALKNHKPPLYLQLIISEMSSCSYAQRFCHQIMTKCRHIVME